jgi:hypothetical protein
MARATQLAQRVDRGAPPVKRDPNAYQRALATQPYLVQLEIADDIGITELVRALAAAGLTLSTLSNVAGRGLRIVRAPTPAKEE